MATITTSALQHLKELEEAMRNDSNFRLEDIENCDKIADLLQGLEFEVKRLKEELEIETIKASVFRHKMTFFDRDLKKEIEENVKAARNSNMVVINDLKEKLEKLTKSIEKLHKRDKELSDEINIMEPEKNSLEANHENIIIKLNDQMAHKASSQIKLNESRDYLRELNQTILDLEEEMINLNEKLVKERAEAREVKIGLEEQKYSTNQKAKEQEEFNDVKNKEVQAIQKSVQESNRSVRTIFRENERLEQLNSDLENEIKHGTEQLLKEQKDLQSLVTESLRLATLEAKTQQDYQENKSNTINKTKETSERTHQEIDNLKNLKETQDKKREELKEIYEKFKELQKIIEQIKKSKEAMRSEIGNKYKEIAELEVKNQKIYEELSDAQQTHNQVMDSLQREAEECKEQLSYDREMRLKKQAERDRKLAEIEQFNANLIIFQSSVTAYLNENKLKTTELKKKENSLNESVDFNQKEKIRLTNELEKANSDYDKMKHDLEENIRKLETELNFYTIENEKNVKEINELDPIYKDVTKIFVETVKDYEETKSILINAKNRKTVLESNINKVKHKINEHDESRDKNKILLSLRREEFLKKMKQQTSESKKLENEILLTGLKLQTVKKENDKFINTIGDFEEDFKIIKSLVVEELNTKDALQAEYDRLHRELVKGWKLDEEIEKLFAKKDLDLIEKLSHLFDKTTDRESKVGQVAIKLYKELQDMDDYLIKMIGKKEIENVSNDSNFIDNNIKNQ